MLSRRSIACCATVFGLAWALGQRLAADATITHTRSATFELTFNNSDVEWSGVPGSPAATLRVREGATPIATDLCVTTVTSDPTAPRRRYFRDARIAEEDGQRRVYAFTRRRERMIGTLDRDDRFVANSTYADSRNLLPTWPEDTATLRYDADADALYVDDSNGDASSTQADSSGPLVSETLDFLPLDLTDEAGQPLSGRYAIEYLTESAPPVVRLLLDRGGKEITIAEASLPETIRGDAVRTGSFDNDRDTYVPDDAYRADVRSSEAEPSVTVTLTGAFTSALRTDGPKLVAAAIGTTVEKPTDAAPAVIRIDGNFDDWRNVPGVDDPRGDSVPYLTYDPDVDLLELKVANDDTHIYLYARVAGRVGHCDPRDGRSYFYAYMDVDRDPQTGFLPSRDDECYYGVTIGDDCEVQFEFVDNRLLKTFYGFCGLGGNENVLEQVATRGKSQYGRFDADGRERADYKVEYIHTGGETRITRDLLAGSSDTIDLAISPDGSEVEIVSSLAGFLQDRSGTPTVGLDQEIDVAAGMECSGEPQWAADSTPPLRGYRLTPTSSSQ